MSNQFYITLPSNTQKGSLASNFTVKMPQRLMLEGEWELGLAEIIYPNSWYNLQEAGENNIIKIGIQPVKKSSLITLNVYVKPGYYQKVDQLLVALSAALEQEPELGPHFRLISNNLPLIRIFINKELIKRIEIGEQLADMLGFDQRIYEYGASEEAVITIDNNAFDNHSEISKQYRARFYNFKNNVMSTMYIYCSIVEDQIIGNTLAPLLRIIDIQGEFGDIINRHFDNPHYVPILVKDISSIEINIKNDMNEFVSFEFGIVVVKLHFRKRSLYFD